MLVLSGRHGGRHCTGQNVHVCVFLLHERGDSEALVGSRIFLKGITAHSVNGGPLNPYFRDDTSP